MKITPYNIPDMKTIPKSIVNRVTEVNQMISQSNQEEIWAVECDSTWETPYTFQEVIVQKHALKIAYEQHDGSPDRFVMDRFHDLEDIRYTLSWIKKCIKKGYREHGLKFELKITS